ncbi:MAG: SMP-30/gluconolactonase/LRE family protein [Actinomycetota bacterium]|nr:SMP-30/gluconolactonase/LRE family protein [Actinomycetota bacterium]
MAVRAATFVEGFVFTEGPRWHDGRLWCSDMHDHRVVEIDGSGRVRTVTEVTGDEPSGLGWLPDGRLLVVSMERQLVLRLEPSGELAVHADLSEVAIGSLNDMIVASDGTAYVGDMGARIHGDGTRRPGQVLMVRADGSFEVAAGDLRSPNGMILDPDQTGLIVAESGGGRLTAFDRDGGGRLSRRRTFAEIVPSDPTVAMATADGICLDAEGAVWFADPVGRRVVRVRPGGVVTDMIDMAPEQPVACVLGGADRGTLYVCAALSWKREELAGTRAGRIAEIPVTVAGAGRP